MDYNILDYGAVGDGVKKCTEAIQAAVDACNKTGGRVVVPAGKYLSGGIRLRSDVELHLENGAELISTLEKEDMIDFASEFEGEGMDGMDGGCFLFARHEKNIIISGYGKIDGRGREVFYDGDVDNGFHECPLFVKGFRPRTTYLEDVENLTVRDITFYDAAFWTLHMAGCRNVMVDGIRILNDDRGPNNDGIDPDCCKNVVIRGCIIEAGDDAIVVKATGPMHEKYGDCENIVIQGCTMHSRDSALKIGTETWGNIRNIILSDCVVWDCSRGVSIWSRDGGTISDITIHHVTGNTRRYADGVIPGQGAPRWWGKGEPVFLSSTKRRGSDRIPGKISGVVMDHIHLRSESCIFLGGEDYAPIEDIRLENMDILWMQQSPHLPGVFDEQPSERDVYAHEIPCVYARSVNGLIVSGRLRVDDSLSGVIQKKQILENCEDAEIEE